MEASLYTLEYTSKDTTYSVGSNYKTGLWLVTLNTTKKGVVEPFCFCSPIVTLDSILVILKLYNIIDA